MTQPRNSDAARISGHSMAIGDLIHFTTTLLSALHKVRHYIRLKPQIVESLPPRDTPHTFGFLQCSGHSTRSLLQ